MNQTYPTIKRIKLAFAELKRDAGPGGEGLSISAVARSAGVSHTLIINDYPTIAEEILEANGRGSKQRLAKCREKLQSTNARAGELRKEVKALNKINRGLASENATLKLSVRSLEDRIAQMEAGIIPLRK